MEEQINNKKDLDFIKEFFKIPKIKSGIDKIDENIKIYIKNKNFLFQKTVLFAIPIFLIFALLLYFFPKILLFLPLLNGFLLSFYLRIIKLHLLFQFIGFFAVFLFSIIMNLIWIIPLIPFFVITFLVLSKLVEKIYKEEFQLKNKYGKKIKEENIESFVMPEFANYIYKGLKFSIEDDFFKESNNFLAMEGIINSYYREKERKNSISLDYEHKNKNLIRGIKLKGLRVITENKYTDDDGSTTYYINNNCYINKIEFKNPKYYIKKEIKIIKDFHEKSKFLSKLGFKKENRVILENQDFENFFDVYCEDQILAREVLTPDFMYKIYDFIKKFNFERSFEFYFNRNYLYIKYNLLSSKSKKNLSKKDIFKIKDYSYYLNFYNEIKNIISLIEDLEIFYYSKSSIVEK